MAVVGFIGLGAMGEPMAANLLRAGHTVQVHARRRAAAEALRAQGARWGPTPAGVARGAAAVFTCVTTTADVEQVLLGKDSVIEGAAKGTLVVDLSTIAAPATREIARRLAEHGIDLLDCPVSGGVPGARAGTLSMFVGGEAAALERARPLLQCLGRHITHVGASGSGQVAKACNQAILVVTIQAIAEAMLLADSQGVSPQRVLDAIGSGYAGSRMLELMGPRMAQRNFGAGIEARLHQKDLGLIVEMAREQGLALPTVALVAQQLNALVGRGWGGDDSSSLLRLLEATHGGRPGERRGGTTTQAA